MPFARHATNFDKLSSASKVYLAGRSKGLRGEARELRIWLIAYGV